MNPKILTIMLAGGAGERLHPLTREIAKPAVPFGGIYRIIDITLSNCLNSGLRRIYILTQHKALTLNRHIRQSWNILSPEVGEMIEILPPTRRVSQDWYLGTADAVFSKCSQHRGGRSRRYAHSRRGPRLQDELPTDVRLAPRTWSRRHGRDNAGLSARGQALWRC